MGSRPSVCVSLVDEDLEVIGKAAPLADLFEVRIDLIGEKWREVVEQLKKPWLACNRSKDEGGKWVGSEPARVDELFRAVGLGAKIIDVELASPDLARIVKTIKGRAECLISYHNNKDTPPLEKLRGIIGKQLAAGADICKVVTTARAFEDNIAVLQLIRDFPRARIVAFAMGEAGRISRVLCPLAGGYFTYASAAAGKESAAGQVTALELSKIYRIMGYGE